jgi:hypothetical protein
VNAIEPFMPHSRHIWRICYLSPHPFKDTHGTQTPPSDFNRCITSINAICHAGLGGQSGHDSNWAKGQAQKGSSSVKKGAASPNGQHGEGGDVNGHKAPDNSNGYTIKPELVNPAQASKK